jgi:hypothetical protein
MAVVIEWQEYEKTLQNVGFAGFVILASLYG